MAMSARCFFVLFVLASAVTAAGAERHSPPVTAWAYVQSDQLDVRTRAGGGKAALRLGRGALIPVVRGRARGSDWIRVRAANPETFDPAEGWVDPNQVEILPAERFPSDLELLRMIGGAFSDDFAAANSVVVRFLVRRGAAEPALVGLVGSPVLPQSRLQVFLPDQGRWKLGPHLEFAFAEIKAPVREPEVRDLTGDGHECFITREPFHLGLESSGVYLVVRRIEDSELRTVWKAPLLFRNFSSFASRIQKLDPPEKNVGWPGTETVATVEFRRQDDRSLPVWKAKISFFQFGRETPVETLEVEKVCEWDGSHFSPVTN
jgi:hypothetical protein